MGYFPQSLYPARRDWTLKPTHLGSLDDLLNELNHQDPQTPDKRKKPKYLYRGQQHQYGAREWPAQRLKDPLIPKDRYRLEPLISSAYRGVEKCERDGKLTPTLALFEQKVARLRGCITVGSCFHVCTCQKEAARAGLLAGPHAKDADTLAEWGYKRLRRWMWDSYRKHGTDYFIAAAQHCGLPTLHVDFSSDKIVALWMALFNFTDNSYAAPAEPVIYRLDFAKLQIAMRKLNPHLAGKQWALLKAIDLRGFQSRLAQRPSGQHGWSLVNFHEPLLLMDLIGSGALEAFTFQSPAQEPITVSQRTTDIKPEFDERALIRRFNSLQASPWQDSRDLRDIITRANTQPPPEWAIAWEESQDLWDAVFTNHWLSGKH